MREGQVQNTREMTVDELADWLGEQLVTADVAAEIHAKGGIALGWAKGPVRVDPVSQLMQLGHMGRRLFDARNSMRRDQVGD